MALIFAEGYESISPEKEIEMWKKFNEKIKDIKYPTLTCVTERKSVEKFLCSVIVELPGFNMLWSAWIDKDVQIGDVVMEQHGNSFFVYKTDFSGQNPVIWLEL